MDTIRKKVTGYGVQGTALQQILRNCNLPYNTRTKPKKQLAKILYSFLISLFVFLFPIPCNLQPIRAITDPLSQNNNRFGVHIISPIQDEIDEAATLINSSGGDWGYVTVVIEDKDRDLTKWQKFFDELRAKHLIPLVRIATHPEGNAWVRPSENAPQEWADFLDQLNWPTKNRYVIVYNEPNHGLEWGGEIDPRSYARVLDKTIQALKNKNENFFVLNAGFDASTPHEPPAYSDQVDFMKQMNEEVPGIFEKLDGWSSHSYPNPEFSGSPHSSGRGTIRTWAWELQQLKDLGVNKTLPVFITETGWKHAEGINYNPRYPQASRLSEYFKIAFDQAWNNNKIVAVTPFLLNYQQKPFDHFSFKKINAEQIVQLTASDETQDQHPEFYPYYKTITEITKPAGQPPQKTSAQLEKGRIYGAIAVDETYDIALTFKNTGQSIWNDRAPVKLVPTEGAQDLSLETLEIPKGKQVKPGESYKFNLKVKAPESGKFQVTLQLFSGEQEFENEPFSFDVEAKAPVVILVKSGVRWKEDAGTYVLGVKGASTDTFTNTELTSSGQSEETQVRYLLPDYSFEFTLSKPFYHSKTITVNLKPGTNVLDFGELEPDLLAALQNPGKLLELLPFSR